MNVDKSDVENCEKLLQTILIKSKFDLTGKEVLETNLLIVWLSRLKNRMVEQLSLPKIEKKK